MRSLVFLLCVLTVITISCQVALAADAGVPGVEVDVGAIPIVTPIPDNLPPPPNVEADPLGSIEQFVDAVKTGNWKLMGALALAVMMFGLRTARSKVAWFRGDRGGAVLVALLGVLGGFSAALAAGVAIDWKLVLGIASVTWTAVGGVHWCKRIIWPKE